MTAALNADLLAGKVAIVTGSTQGVGADIARVLSACGATVVVVGRNDAAGQALVWELTSEPGAQAIYCAVDIEQDAQIDQCVSTMIERFGRIDILVNNACIYTDDAQTMRRAVSRTQEKELALDVVKQRPTQGITMRI